MPWDHLLGARVRGSLRHHGITSGSLVGADPDHPRSTSAQALASLDTRRDTDRGGSLWGQSRVVLVWGPPKSSRPVGVVFSQPAPALRAWYKPDKSLQQPGRPARHRPRKPAPPPQSPTQEQRALRFLAACKAQQPAVRLPAGMAEALSGTATGVAGASALCRGVQGSAPIRRQQNMRVGQRPQPGAADGAPQPGPPSSIRLRGGVAGVAMGGRARLSVGAHNTNRVIVALQ